MVTTAPPKQTHAFEMHPELLRHVMGRQAPSLAKALLEGVMNAVDAAATRILITIDDKRVIIDDDGHGLAGNIEELKRTFGRFGEPHEPDDVPFGEFRMGRGQLLNQGPTTYESGPFRISVDIHGNGFQWDVEESGRFVQGCRITLDLLNPIDRASEVAEFETLVRHIPVPITIDGRTVNESPHTATWDFETDDAWFRIAAGPLRVYNRGAHVRDYPAETWGLGGTVVSKKRLTVTFGRNEVLRACPVFQRITRHLDDAFIATLAQRKTRSLPEAMRARALHLFCTGRLPIDTIGDLRLLRDARGAWLSLLGLLRYTAVVVGPTGDALAWRAIESGKALVLAADDVTALGIDLRRLLAVLRKATDAAPILLTWSDVIADLALGRTTIPDESLDPHQRAILFGAQVASRAIAHLVEATDAIDGAVPVRRVIAAKEDSEDIFSDGETFIAISIRILDQLSKGAFSFTKASMLLAHAYLRTPMPSDGEEETDLAAFMRDSIAANGLRTLAFTHIGHFSVNRSPLQGDPHTHPRWRINHVPIRDVGDAARAWAEDYARRCPGLGIKPKVTLLMAAGVRRQTDLNEDITAPTTPEDWFDAFQAALQSRQRTFALDHWTVTRSGFRLQATRGKPARTKADRATSQDRWWLAEAFSHSSRNPDAARHKRWLAEPLPALKPDLPPLPFTIGTTKSLRPVTDVVHEVVSLLVDAECALGRLRVDFYTHDTQDHRRDRSASQRAALLAYGHAADIHWPGQTEPHRGFKPSLPHLYARFDTKGHATFTLDCEHGPYRPSDSHWRDTEGTPWSGTLAVRSWLIRDLGWPRLARMLRRWALRSAGRQSLAHWGLRQHAAFKRHT